MPERPPERTCIQLNWQRDFGGGELFTRFFSEALVSLGWKVRLVVHDRARFWRDLAIQDTELIGFSDASEIPRLLLEQPGVVVTHTPLPADVVALVSSRKRLGGIVHIPMHERDPRSLRQYPIVFPVSGYVRSTLVAKGMRNVFGQPLLGVADLRPRRDGDGRIVRGSIFQWDRRKVRDSLLSLLEPVARVLPAPTFERRPGLTLGIVSRLTPIKQFPLLFTRLAPVLKAFPGVNLEVFGAGGYASVRDLKAALAPLGGQVRYWGFQPDPAAVYRQLDYVLSGLPEHEALGLNLIEAQVAGTPVLAVNAPPFNETVMDGVSGFLYRDPREDDGADFRRCLQSIVSGQARPDLAGAGSHLEKFGVDAFAGRVQAAMDALVR